MRSAIHHVVLLLTLGGAPAAALAADCQSDQDCRGDRICVEGSCRFTCARDMDCPASMVCDRRICAAAPAGAAATPAAPAPQPDTADQPKNAEPEYRVEYKSNKGLWIGGIAMLGGAWLATALTTHFVTSVDGGCDYYYDDYDECQAEEDRDADLRTSSLIPLAGPWLMLGSGNVADEWESIVVMSGLLQVGGTAMIVLGFTLKSEKRVRVAGVDLDFAPTAGTDGPGWTLFGRF